MDASLPLENALFFVSGSTGSGKSSIAVLLADKLKKRGYEQVIIINCDVSQFYVELPIATNKVRRCEMKGVKHVFLGFLSADDAFVREPEEPYAGSDQPQSFHQVKDKAYFDGIHSYIDRVSKYIGNVFSQSQKTAVVLCGGTCYYIQSILIENMLVDNEHAVTSDHVEDKDLWQHVNSVDPEIASRYHPNDTRRLRRLLDIYLSSGKKPTELYEETKRFRFDPRICFFIWVFRPLEALYPLLDQRVDAMVAQGLVHEARQFFNEKRDYEKKTSLFEAIGVKEFLEVWQNAGEDTPTDSGIDKAIENIKAHTRNYANKQVRWLNNRLPPLLVNAAYNGSIFDFSRHYVKLNLDASSADGLDTRVDRLLDFFLHKGLCELPKDTADFPLVEEKKDTPPVTQEYCALCDFIVYGRDQMGVHLNSKRHRGALKRQHLEKSHLEQFGVPIPPRKRHKKEKEEET